jgi:hypothetical protein
LVGKHYGKTSLEKCADDVVIREYYITMNLMICAGYLVLVVCSKFYEDVIDLMSHSDGGDKKCIQNYNGETYSKADSDET